MPGTAENAENHGNNEKFRKNHQILKDTHREKAPPKKTPVLTRSTIMDILDL